MQQTPLNRARNDKFLLVLDLPKAMKGLKDFTLQEGFKADSIQFTCYGSPVPTIGVKHIDIPYGGQTHKVSSHSRDSYENLKVSFFVDNGYKNYYCIFQWLNLLNHSKSGEISYNYKYPDENYDKFFSNVPFADMVSRFSTFALDEYNNKILRFDYNNVFPTQLDALNYSHQNPEEISSNISFAFNQVHCSFLKNVDDSNC